MITLLCRWTSPTVVQQWDRNIQKNRTDEFVFRFVDKDNNPVCNTDIQVTMIAHEFRFGMQSLQSAVFNSLETKARYDDWVHHTLNQTTVHTCWRWIEPYSQDYRFGNLERSILDADKYEAKKVAHCLFWDHPDWFKPAWVSSDLSPEAYMALWRHYIDAVAEKYSDKIDAWHVINEATFKEDGRISDRIIVPDGFYQAFDYVRRKLKGEYGACFYHDVFQTIFEKNNLSPFNFRRT